MLHLALPSTSCFSPTASCQSLYLTPIFHPLGLNTFPWIMQLHCSCRSIYCMDAGRWMCSFFNVFNSFSVFFCECVSAQVVCWDLWKTQC